jgi:hypothetical protein
MPQRVEPFLSEGQVGNRNKTLPCIDSAAKSIAYCRVQTRDWYVDMLRTIVSAHLRPHPLA